MRVYYPSLYLYNNIKLILSDQINGDTFFWHYDTLTKTIFARADIIIWR